MIGQLTGAVASEDADGSLVLDVGGVGYELLAPLGMLGRAKANASSERLTLYVHTHVREDALLLYAFATPEDKASFARSSGSRTSGPRWRWRSCPRCLATSCRGGSRQGPGQAGGGARHWQEDRRAAAAGAKRQAGARSVRLALASPATPPPAPTADECRAAFGRAHPPGLPAQRG